MSVIGSTISEIDAGMKAVSWCSYATRRISSKRLWRLSKVVVVEASHEDSSLLWDCSYCGGRQVRWEQWKEVDGLSSKTQRTRVVIVRNFPTFEVMPLSAVASYNTVQNCMLIGKTTMWCDGKPPEEIRWSKDRLGGIPSTNVRNEAMATVIHQWRSLTERSLAYHSMGSLRARCSWPDYFSIFSYDVVICRSKISFKTKKSSPLKSDYQYSDSCKKHGHT